MDWDCDCYCFSFFLSPCLSFEWMTFLPSFFFLTRVWTNRWMWNSSESPFSPLTLVRMCEWKLILIFFLSHIYLHYSNLTLFSFTSKWLKLGLPDILCIVQGRFIFVSFTLREWSGYSTVVLKCWSSSSV